MGFRTWLILIGIAVIVAIFVDSWRRFRAERKSSLQLKIDKALRKKSASNDPFNGELPTGEVRIRPQSVMQANESDQARVEPQQPSASSPSTAGLNQQTANQTPLASESLSPKPAVVADNTNPSVSHDATSETVKPAKAKGVNQAHSFVDLSRRAMAIAAGQPDQSTRQEPQLTDQDLAVMQTKVESAQAVDQASQSGSRLLQKVTPRCHRVVKQPETSQQSADNQVTHLLKPENDTGQSALAAKDKQSDWPQLLVTNEADKPLMQQEIAKDQLIIVNIQARQEAGFTGPELLQALLSCGLRFGEMDIFHRYQRAQSQEQIQFSLASGVKPGSFNLDDMGSFSTPLLSLFLKLPGPDQPLAAFDSMLEVADKLVNTLTGDLQNKDRQTLSLQQIANYRELIQLWVKQHQQTASLCVDAA